MHKLSEVLQQNSVTSALAGIYGPVQLEIQSQQLVSTPVVPAPYAALFQASDGPLLERRIKLLVNSAQKTMQPIVYALSWIRLSMLSSSAQKDLRQGTRMLGEILSGETELEMQDDGVQSGISREIAHELTIPEDSELLFRWRYWRTTQEPMVVLLLECAPLIGPESRLVPAQEQTSAAGAY
jgi:chorismate-pyruvate lyase